MKEDYLWNKTGDDAEIEQLENALAAFRYQENAPPALAQKVFTLEPAPRKSFFRFAFPAFAACASVLIVLSVVWFQFSDDKTPAVAENISAANVVNRAQKTAGESFIEPRAIADPVIPIEKNQSSVAPSIVKVRQPGAFVVRRRGKPEARIKKFTEPVEPLTKEEQYAYDQLMLALTITGSKLKIVQDKINGVEQEAVVGGR